MLLLQILIIWGLYNYIYIYTVYTDRRSFKISFQHLRNLHVHTCTLETITIYTILSKHIARMSKTALVHTCTCTCTIEIAVSEDGEQKVI